MISILADIIKAHMQLLLKHRMGSIGLIIILLFFFIAVFAPLLGTVNPGLSGEFEHILEPPSLRFWLGTDDLARDVWSQTLYGARVSLAIGLTAAAITIISGTLVGLIAGFFGGLIEEILMRIVDFFMMLPELPLMIVLAAVLGPGLWNIILVVSLVSWPTTARVVRSQVLSLKERPFVEAAVSIGAGNTTVMFAEILPNVLPLMFAQAVTMVTEAVYAEAVLSFLGLGDPDTISWGGMLHSAFESGVISQAFWWVIPPIICIVGLIVSFSFLGTAIGDILKPGYREVHF